MNTINIGEVYMLNTPIVCNSEERGDMKRVIYAMGGLDSRPVVVVRPPMAWDRYNTVTVIPAHTDTNFPHIRVEQKGLYGTRTVKVFNFCPHEVHTIYVNRLYRLMGRLDQNELDELMYAYHWVNSDWNLKPDEYEVPECYQDTEEYEAINRSLHDRDLMWINDPVRYNSELDTLEYKGNKMPLKVNKNVFPAGWKGQLRNRSYDGPSARLVTPHTFNAEETEPTQMHQDSNVSADGDKVVNFPKDDETDASIEVYSSMTSPEYSIHYEDVYSSFTVSEWNALLSKKKEHDMKIPLISEFENNISIYNIMGTFPPNVMEKVVARHMRLTPGDFFDIIPRCNTRSFSKIFNIHLKYAKSLMIVYHTMVDLSNKIIQEQQPKES